MRTRRIGVAALVGILALLIGCTSPGSRDRTPPPPTPASSAYLDALEHTRSLGTASMVVDGRSQSGEASTRLTGTGAVAFYDGHGDMLWTSDGSAWRERSNGRGVFVQEAPPDGPWRRAESPSVTVALTDPLRGLGQVGTPVGLGPDVVEGEPTERYAGTAPATDEQLTLLGLDPAALSILAADRDALEVRITVWIDDGGRMLRIDRELVTSDGPAPVTAMVTTRLSDFSRVIDLSTPPGIAD